MCILTPELTPVWGGVGTYSYNAARALRDRVEVHVLAGAAPPRDGGTDLDGIEVHEAFPRGKPRNEASAFRFQLAVFRRLPRLANEHAFDIVHVNHAYMSDILARLRPSRAETVVTVHTTLNTQAGGTLRAGHRPRRGIEGRIARWRSFLQAVEGRYLRKSGTMIFVSRWIRDQTVQRYGVEPRVSAVVPNAIDLARFSATGGKYPAVGGEEPVILFAGRLLALKGVETLLHAVARLGPRVRLLLAGPGDQRPWRELAASLGLGDGRCTFLGRVPYEAMPDLYRQASAVVLPSFTESYPIVALEAMASGTPLIAAGVGGIPEIVRRGETGWLFPAGDADALAECIESVIGDEARARQVAVAARRWVEENASMDVMADRTYQVYERAMAGVCS